jgi:cytochrome c biogenesis protein CcdA/thiol-disulfide isomerase/thioredoxin
MLVLLGVGFVAGLITGISPCILPVLPVIVAGGSASEDRRRPFAIIAGLVLCFAAAVLGGGALLSLLDLPQDLLERLGIVLLIVLGVGLLVPAVGQLLERPFARLGGSRQASTGGGFVLGMSLGLVFVPCAGPVLATIAVVSATRHVGFSAVLLTLAYAAGVAVPLLAVALVAQRTTTHWAPLRRHAPLVRQVAGGLIVITALAIGLLNVLNVTDPLTKVPGYTSALQSHVEGSSGVLNRLNGLTGEKANRFVRKSVAVDSLPVLGKAPAFTGITAWLNTPGGRPLTMAGLRGHVVLVDFWTYSCINCQRELPHVEAWYKNYAADGFVVVGVHSPEFSFEHVVSNVQTAVGQLGVTFPVAVDDNLATWDAYNNEYWPAEYLIDQTGHVRYVSFGEGDYGTTEMDIRSLLMTGGALHLAPPTDVPDRTPTTETTPESYLGYDRLTNYAGSPVRDGRSATYTFAPSLPADTLSLAGTWTVNSEEITAGPAAKLELNYTASDVYLVLGGQGTLTVSTNGGPARTIAVSGIPRLYTLLSGPSSTRGVLSVTFTPGIEAYDFTFG